jgi:hypothetical protein
MTPASFASAFDELSRELLGDARSDYRMCIDCGLIDSTPDTWQTFIEGYADQAAFYVRIGISPQRHVSFSP